MTLREVRLEPDTPTEGYPFDLPAVRALFVVDEPEATLSFTGQLALVQAMLDGVAERSYDDLQVVAMWRSFLDAPERILRHLG